MSACWLFAYHSDDWTPRKTNGGLIRDVFPRERRFTFGSERSLSTDLCKMFQNYRIYVCDVDRNFLQEKFASNFS